MKKLLFLLAAIVFFTGLPVLDAAADMNKGEVTFRFSIKGPKDAKNVRLWVPYPVSGRFQSIEDVEVSGNFDKSAVYREPEYGNLALFAEWNNTTDERKLVFRFKVLAKEQRVDRMLEEKAPFPVEVRKFLAARPPMITTCGKVKQIADRITRNKDSILEKAKAVYDWTVENTYRDPGVKGCGMGMADRIIVEKGGKCADISSVFVALARAAGVPAREVFGLRLGKDKDQDITGGFHCWAEFYLPGTGWIPVDPADVRKMMLVHQLDLSGAEKYRKHFFGALDAYRIVLGKGGRGILLSPPQESGPLNYFMYPFAEVDGKPLDYLDPGSFSYKVVFKPIQP